MITLRPYQEAAVQAVYEHLRERDDNPCVVLPTAAGKTPVLATICRDAVTCWGGRVIVLAHVKELLEQAVDKVARVAPELANRVGVYSAGLGRRDTQHPVIVAGIQSVYQRACELDAFDLAIIDESHMIPTDGDGRYRTFLQDAMTVNPELRVVGLTATPFRMKTGMICAPENILNHVCYEVGIRELIRDGFLSPLITKSGRERVDTSKLHIRHGEFLPGEAEALMDRDEVVEAACEEIIEYTSSRNSCLIFATGVGHAQHIASELRDAHGVEVATVFGSTPSDERRKVLEAFQTGAIKYLVNVGVLTTGFDAPSIDCVALVRPTASPGLYYQMVGRGFRLHRGKDDCLVLDFGENVMRHGPVDAISVQPAGGSDKKGEAPAKVCPECMAVIAAGCGVCPDCGFVFPPRVRGHHEKKASTVGILSGEVTTTEYEVMATRYALHVKRDAPPDAPRTLRVEYRTGLNEYQSEWICLEHAGWARDLAESWWRRRSDAPIPRTVEEALYWIEDGRLAATRSITVRRITGEKYGRIISHRIDEKPPYREPGWDEDMEEDPAEVVEYEEAPF